jgi:hypothetical protein
LQPDVYQDSGYIENIHKLPEKQQDQPINDKFKISHNIQAPIKATKLKNL